MLVPTADELLPSMAILVWARRTSDEPVIIEDGGRVWSWRMIAAAAADVADRLPDVTDQPVALTVPNGGAFVAGLMGIWLAGGVPAPVSPRLPAVERAKVLLSISPARTVSSAELGLDDDVTVDVDALAVTSMPDDPAFTLPRHRPDAPGIVICTSGTTGVPKAVLHTQRGLWAFIDSVASRPLDVDAPRAPKVDGQPVRVDSRPMVHSGAIYGLLSTMWRGRSLVAMQRFDPIRYAELVRDHRVENLSLVPTMVRMLLDAGDSVGALAPPARVVSTGTAPMPDAWLAEFESRFGVPIQRTYGSTEAGTVALEPIDDVLAGHRRAGSSGKVVPQVEVRIRDDENLDLRVDELGSIWVRGLSIQPTVIGGGELADFDGWIDTGDLGRLDADGYIYITGRKRELIIRGGLKMVPAEIEAALLEHPAVVEAVVAGVPDERLGEVPVAWVRVAAEVSAEALRDHAYAQLAAYKVPVSVYFVDDFPRTDSGKVQKRILIDRVVASSRR